MKSVNLNKPQRVVLTDTRIAALKLPAKGKRIDTYDVIVPKLLVRVTDTGSKTFLFRTYFPGQKFAARRIIGKVGAMNIDQARTKAREWHQLLEQKIDPQVEQKRQAEQVKQAEQAKLRADNATFLAVAEAYIAFTRSAGREKAKPTKTGKPSVIEREITKELISRWAARPIHSIIAVDVIEVLDTIVARGSTYQAYTIYERINSIWKWAKKSGRYGLISSPTDGLSAADVIGSGKKQRQRVLTDDELRALWGAIEKEPYPWQPLYKLLVLSGQRLSDISDASWGEIDLNSKLFTIPEGRFKSDAKHVVPLTKPMLAILSGLPRFKSGDYLFSANFGKDPVAGFSKPKERLDHRMLEQLRTVAIGRGDQALLAYVVKVEQIISRIAEAKPGSDAQKQLRLELKRVWWVVHDIRRTMRSHLSALPIEEHVRERVIGHGKKGLARVYDQYAYVPEKRAGLNLWYRRLTKILNPPTRRRAALPDNVTRLPVRKRG